MWLESDEGNKILFYKRYVDDIFCILENENDSVQFLEYLNSRHQNLKFTLEKEIDKKLPFLDILICKNETGLKTSIYRKKTDTGLLTNFNSFISYGYKLGLIKTLIDRVYKINSSRQGFMSDIEVTKQILQKNEYSRKLVDDKVRQ